MTPATQPILAPQIEVIQGVLHAEPTLDDNLASRPITALFDQAFDLYRRHFVKLSLILAVGFVPLQIVLHALVNFWLRPWAVRIDGLSNDDQVAQGLLVGVGYLCTGYPQYGIPGLFSLIALLILSGPVAVGVAAALHGEPVSVRLAYFRLRRVFFRLAGLWLAAITGSIVIALISAFVMMFGISVIALAIAEAMPELVGYLILFGVTLVPYVLVAAFIARTFLLASPLIILEGRTVGEVPTRNGQLIKGSKFRKIWVATIGFPLIVLGLRFFVMGGMASLLPSFALPPSLNFVVESLLSTLIYFFFEPFWMIFLTLLYFDGRVRRDGYDIYKMAEALEPRQGDIP